MYSFTNDPDTGWYTAPKKKTFEEKIMEKLWPEEDKRWSSVPYISGLTISSNVPGTWATLTVGSSGMHNITIQASGSLRISTTTGGSVGSMTLAPGSNLTIQGGSVYVP